MHLNPARRRRALAVLLAAALAPALGLAVAQPAAAHDRLLSSDPADGATLDAPPAQLALVFSAEVLEAGAQVSVTTPDGTTPARVSVDGDEVVAALPADLPGGEWDVAWRVVSSDGHPIEGELGYTVADAAPSPSPGAPSAGPSPSPSGTPTTASPTPSDETPAAAGHGHGGTPGADLDADGEAGWATAWLFPVAVLAAVGVAAAVVLRLRRRDEPGSGPDDADPDA
ncbi:copper resistance protein CopC [Isoptericola sp. 4D.3]|uniref:Copper resistance protein CopC n=1 Tax=Isoptericola peretonis TaxID=2918523 RepID=A0ABT0J338_9MICO|nr:copper resistance protein CopC [Isoptericola sp. 4D.3]